MTSAEPGTQNKEGEPSQCLKLLNNNDVIIENNEMTLAECDVRTVYFDFFLNCQINNLSNLAFQFGTFKFKYGKNSLRSGKCNSLENTCFSLFENRLPPLHCPKGNRFSAM